MVIVRVQGLTLLFRVGLDACDYRAAIECELRIETLRSGPLRSPFLAVVGAVRCRVEGIKFEEDVVAIVVARVAEEDVVASR